MSQLLIDNVVNYCILHDWETLPYGVRSDLDIIVSSEELNKLETELQENNNYKLVQLLQHESSCYYFVLVSKNKDGHNYIPLDAATDYRRDGYIYFSDDELLHNKQKWGDYWVASPAVEFKYLLTKKILKESVSQNQKERLNILCHKLGVDAHSISQELFGQTIGERVVAWITSEKWEIFEANIKKLRRSLFWHILKKDPLNPIRYWIPEIKRIWRRVRYPTGLFIAVLGPDGAGKSTLIQNLQREINRAFRNITIYHFRPNIFRKQKFLDPVTNPHGKSPRSGIISNLKSLYYFFDYGIGYFLKIRPSLVRSTLVIFDRYYDDILIDPYRYRISNNCVYTRLIHKFIPKPDLYLFLSVSERLLISRKQEVGIQELRRQNAEYNNLAFRVSNAIVLDGSLSEDVVAQKGRDIILEYLSHRYKDRRHIYFKSEISSERNDIMSFLFSVNGDGQCNTIDDTHGNLLYLPLNDGRCYLIPDKGKISTHSLKIYHTQNIKATLVKTILSILLKIGVVQQFIKKVPINNLNTINSFIHYFNSVFGYNDLIISVSLGTPGNHRKPVIQIMESTGNILGYAKIGWNNETVELVKNETHVLELLSHNQLSFQVPELIHKDDWNGNYVCIQSPANQKAGSASQKPIPIYIKAIEEIAEMNITFNIISETQFWNSIIKRKDNIQNSYYRYVIERGIDFIVNNNRDQKIPFHRNHGDFAPWNALISNNQLFLYDWEYSQEYAPAFYDIFHFILQTEYLLKKSNAGKILDSITNHIRNDMLKNYKSLTKVNESSVQVFLLLYLLDRLTIYASNDPHKFEFLQLLSMMINICVIKET
jgi:thymidylate kinase